MTQEKEILMFYFVHYLLIGVAILLHLRNIESPTAAAVAFDMYVFGMAGYFFIAAKKKKL